MSELRLERLSMCETTGTAVPAFTHLHGHTKFSRGDSTNTPLELVKKAFADGQKAIAVTDHGVASSWIEMFKACKSVTEDARAKERERLTEVGLPVDEDAIQQIGIKFIPGVEMYETDDRTIKSKAEMEEYGFSTHHFLLLPKNNEGLKNLNRIISDASEHGQFSGRNRTDMHVIRANGWGKDLVATSACLASRTSQLILKGDIDGAEKFALECADLFDEFYLELQDNNIKDQYIVNQGLQVIAERTGLPLVFTQDYHYLDAEDDDLHDTWICIGRKQSKHDPNRVGYDGGPYHFATQEEMFKSVEQGLIPLEAYANTVKIADSCNVEFNLKLNRFPKFPFLDKGHSADSQLRKLTLKRLWDYLLEEEEIGKFHDANEYLERLNYELKVISDKKYSDYFLILNDLMEFCHTSNIYTGPARGSGGGSLVAFLSRITDVDAVEHGLLFERFLNPERMSAPDKYLVA